MILRALLSFCLVALCCASQAQGVEPRIQASWGTNLLTSPGTDIRSSPGRTGSIGAAFTIGNGWERKLRIQPTILYTGSAYNTRMAYRTFFVTVRNSVQLDLLLAFPQMNGANLLIGPFFGKVQRTNAFFQQGDQNSAYQGYVGARAQSEHYPVKREAGLVLGISFPFRENGSFGMDILLRQHIVPLVEKDQFFAMQFSPDQQVLATNTRPTILSLGLHCRFK